MNTLTKILTTIKDFEEAVEALSDRSDALSSERRIPKLMKEQLSAYNTLIAAAKIGFEHYIWKHKLTRDAVDTKAFPYRDVSRYLTAEEQLQYHKRIKYGRTYFDKLDVIDEELGEISRQLNNKLDRKNRSAEDDQKAFAKNSDRRKELQACKQFLLSIEDQTLALYKKCADLKAAQSAEPDVNTPTKSESPKFTLSSHRLPVITMASRASQPLTVDALAAAQKQLTPRKPILIRSFS